MSKKIIFTVLVMIAIVSLAIFFRVQNQDLLLQGEVDAPEVIVASKAKGRVVERLIERGDDVKAGQVIIRLDAPELVAQLKAAEAARDQAKFTLEMSQNGTREESIRQLTATLAGAKADYQTAEATYRRNQSVAAKGYISALDLDNARNSRDTALHSMQSAQANLDEAKHGDRWEQRDVYSAQLQQAEQQLAEIKVQTDDLNVKAPVDGEVGPIPAEVGDLLSASSPLVTLVRLPQAYFVFNLREDILAHVRKGDVIRLRVPALNNQLIEARVHYIAPLGDFSTKSATRATGDFDLKTFEVRLWPTQPVNGLRQGNERAMAVETLKKGLRAFRRAFNKEIRISSRKPAIHWLTWCFPLLLFWLLSSNFSEGTLMDLPVAVVDNDHSQLSRELIRKLDASPHAKLTEWEGGLDEALHKMRTAQDYGLVYIPPDFEKHLLAAKHPKVAFYYNALYYGAGLYSTQDFSGLVTAINSEYRSAVEAKIGKTAPSLPSVSLVYRSLFNASGSYIYYQQFAATIHLIQLFVVTSMIYVLSRSKSLIYVDRFGWALLGKLAPYTLVYTTILMGEIALLVWVFSARFVGDPYYMFFVAFFYIMAAQSLGLMLFTFTRTAISAYTLMAIFVTIALAFSGLGMPELSMPLPAQFIANLEPLTHALYAMFDLFIRKVPAKPVIGVCALLAVYPIVVGLLVFRRLPKRLRDQEAMV